jgi:hypothetical protein
MSIESESLLAATGFIDPVIDAPALERADAVPVRLAERVRTWLTGGRSHAWVPQRSYDPERLRERISADVADAPGMESLPEVLAAEWLLEVNDARRSCLERWPALHLQGGLDAREPPLAFDRKQDWLTMVGSVEDFFGFLTDLELGSALPDAVNMVREVYPDLSDLITEAMFATIVELADKKRDLAPGKERSARLWLGIEANVPLVQAAQQGQESPQKPPSKPAEDVKTQSQKAGM